MQCPTQMFTEVLTQRGPAARRERSHDVVRHKGKSIPSPALRPQLHRRVPRQVLRKRADWGVEGKLSVSSDHDRSCWLSAKVGP